MEFVVDYRPCTVALIKTQPRLVLFQQFRVFKQMRLVRQALEKDTDRTQRQRLFAHTLIEHPAQTAAGSPGGHRYEFQIAEIQIRDMQQQREPLDMIGRVLGDKHNGAKLVFDRVTQLPRQLVDLLLRGKRKLAAHDFGNMHKCLSIGWRNIIVNGADTQHVWALGTVTPAAAGAGYYGIKTLQATAVSQYHLEFVSQAPDQIRAIIQRTDIDWSGRSRDTTLNKSERLADTVLAV